MTATKKSRQHPKPPTRSALARPTGSARAWLVMRDGREESFYCHDTKLMMRYLRMLVSFSTPKVIVLRQCKQNSDYIAPNEGTQPRESSRIG
jgi:hypothetical protein